MQTNDIVASGYKMKVQFSNGMNIRQRVYNDFIPVFDYSIDLLSSYPHDHPLNPKDRDTYMRQSRICKNKIFVLKEKFIDGIINLDETQLAQFRFLIAREINDSIDELYKKLKVKFSYPRLHEHFDEKVPLKTYLRILEIIPLGEYRALNAKLPQKVSA
jgi:hypothetical protein